MGQYVFKLPDVGEGTAEAEIIAWHVRIGDEVKEDAPLLDVMTDKATVEMTSPVAGRIVEIKGEPGDMAAVGAAIVVFDIGGAAEQPAANGHANEPEKPPEAPPQKPRMRVPAVAAPTGSTPVPAPKPPETAPVKASVASPPALYQKPRALAAPAVRARAERLGVDLSDVQGSGPDGQVTHADLDQALVARGGGVALQARAQIEPVKVIGLRRKIAEKMQGANEIPHFSYVEELDVTALEELRAHLNAAKRADRPKLTLLPFLMRAMAKTLEDYPQINARFDSSEGVIYRHQAVDIGIATQTDNGLIVPVVRHVEARDIWDCAAEMQRVSTAARDGTAGKAELAGSTITITSLGALGGIASTPVLNAPEVAIIGVNKMVERPVVLNGQIVVRKMMNLSSSFDHRVVDGYDAAAFIQAVKRLLENPAALFVEM